MENNQSVDTEALKKELEDFILIAKKEKGKIEELAVGITTKSEEIKLFYETFSDLRTKITDGQSGGQALLDQSTNLKAQIEQVDENVQKQSAQITEKINTIDVKIQEIENYYGTFTVLKNKIDDGQTGLQALLDQSTILKNSIDQLNTSTQISIEQIKGNVTSITDKVQEIEEYYTSTFIPLKEKVNDENSGIQAILGSAISVKEEIIKTKSGADESYREIKNLTDKSKELKEKSKISNDEIEELKKRSAEFKADIEQTFKIATDVSLANSFNERKKDLDKEAGKWLWHVSFSTTILVILVVGIFCSQYLPDSAQLHDWRFWYRFVFTSPVIFYVAFASHHYNKTRDLLEKYAFKFATSLSLQSYAKLLTDNFKNDRHQDELLKFSIRSIDMVYKEPYIEKDKTRKISFGNKIVNVGLEDIETLVKENVDITKLFPGEKKSEEK